MKIYEANLKRSKTKTVYGLTGNHIFHPRSVVSGGSGHTRGVSPLLLWDIDRWVCLWDQISFDHTLTWKKWRAWEEITLYKFDCMKWHPVINTQRQKSELITIVFTWVHCSQSLEFDSDLKGGTIMYCRKEVLRSLHLNVVIL